MFRNLAWKTIAAASSLLIGSVSCKQRKHEVYIWGNGSYQARPDALLQFSNFFPKKINNLPPNLVCLHFGQYYEAGIDSNGSLFVWNKRCTDANLDQDNKDQLRQGIIMVQKDVKSVRFTSGYIWTLDKTGKVYQFPILKKFDQDNNLIEKSIGERRQVEPLRGTVQLQTGRDHLLALSQKGQILAMGDDTYGQCGQADVDRNTSPPFVEKRIKFPHKVKNISEVVSISVGDDHNLAVDKLGNLFGWGSNNSLQISHEQQFSKMNNPLICSYNPLKISKNLDHSVIKKVVAGGEFSVLVTENKQTKSNQVFTFGSNLRGQLAIDEVKHFKDVSKVSKLSNYVMKVKGADKKVEIEQIQCGKNHCIALLNIGYIMEWGDNEQGQMGNKKRSPSMVPIILRDFIGKKIVGVFASEYNSGVIVEAETQSN